MRLFVAADLPPVITAEAAAIGATVRERLARFAPRARVTWVAPDRMHLTLRFLGEVEAERGAAVVLALAEPLRTPAFGVGLGQPGVFPPHGAPRVIWVGLRARGDALGTLEQEVSTRLDGAGIPREPRPFSPHLTLGRVRQPDGLRAARLLDGVEPPRDIVGTVEAITLFESRLSPRGPTYTAVQRTTLSRA